MRCVLKKDPLSAMALRMTSAYANGSPINVAPPTVNGVPRQGETLSADKGQVQRMVQRLTGLDPALRMRLDETDAIALALAALYQGSHPLARLAARR